VSTARLSKILSRLRSKEDSQECFSVKEAIAAPLRALMEANTMSIAPVQSAAAPVPVPVSAPLPVPVPSVLQPSSSIASSTSSSSSVPPSPSLIDSNSVLPSNLESVPVQGLTPLLPPIIYTSTVSTCLVQYSVRNICPMGDFLKCQKRCLLPARLFN
jgi:hypothetical protein